MPFTIGGEWIPEPMPAIKSKLPIKVIKEKRGSSIVTIILNLPLQTEELKFLCSTLKQKFGCGGAVKSNQIELQGDNVQRVKDHLKQKKS
ncbi:translation initiation factor [Candidatus Protochlamydia sp. R18]|uniref:translation initiation factor n=1 Tax=Candidatus Protochlamydia sp. R18 TaxID=1353977 RepID=UPI0006941676|nr:translation initiation factor [Candidatus Protochlamydia sp. R18]